MPPVRTPVPVKPLKTERSHEENQERAYIAASRRSDRSLEARVESARRASEIHKRRTGRSLRVTEQDVINEEMYEEEDDDLPSQYRRLTAHLQTGSADFNRRLAAYLTNHVAMRSALDQAITASYAQQFPNAPKFAHNHPGAFPSPFQPSSESWSPTIPQSPQSIHPYRQAPYPMPGTSGYRQGSHHRSASISTEKELQAEPSASIESPSLHQSLGSRRQSMPVSNSSPSELKAEFMSSMSPPNSKLSESQDELALRQIRSFNPSNLSPFTMSLPPSTQQLVGSSLDPADPFTSTLMAGSEHIQLPSYNNTFFNYMAEDIEKSHGKGIDPTLAPATPNPSQHGTIKREVDDPIITSPTSPIFGASFDDLKDTGFPSSISEAKSREGTPGTDGIWDTFINETPWAENEI